MINITTTKDIPGYAKPYVIASITHAFKPSDLTHIVEQAIKTGHLKAILAGLPEEMQQLLNNRGREEESAYNLYMVSADHAKAPKHTHATEEDASKEACRLARLCPGTYRVLKIVKVMSSIRKIVQKVQEEEVIEIDDTWKP